MQHLKGLSKFHTAVALETINAIIVHEVKIKTVNLKLITAFDEILLLLLYAVVEIIPLKVEL